MSSEKFVFVVCGGKEHIDTLHFSLRYLRHFSQKDIIVVTDSTRNEIKVEHDHVINVKTPTGFTHHQASIYLKVGLNRFLPKGFNYCYLDTDVVALDVECDSIFSYKKGPVTFAADHCRMPEFSPSAVTCACIEKSRKDITELEALIKRYDPAEILKNPDFIERRNQVLKKFDSIKRNPLKNAWISLRFNLAKDKFVLDDDTIYDVKGKYWHNSKGENIFVTGTMEEGVEKNSSYKWDRSKNQWLNSTGNHVYGYECQHLREAIFSLWGIAIPDENYQHWNGGVFLFDDSSEEFLNKWFDKTMQIFKTPGWQTRDQGTLIATAWELGVQDNPLLPVEFNFIADYQNPALQISKDGKLSTDGFISSVKPHFIHIFHSFGKKGWPVWDYVCSINNVNQ